MNNCIAEHRIAEHHSFVISLPRTQTASSFVEED